MKDAIALFFALSTQWRWLGGMAVIRTGLDYAAIEPTARGLELPVTPGLFNDIRTLELAALDAWSQK